MAEGVLTNGRNDNLICFAFGNEENSVMQRGSLADLTSFIAVADSLSFRAAASQLGVTPSALSHSMRQLEERIGTRLLNRTTRSVSLTDAGLRLLERLRPAVDQITDALEDLNRERGRPVGRLRIYATNTAAMTVIAPVWSRFLSTYPEVNLEVEVGEPSIDIVAKGFDAGIGAQNRIATDMIAVRVTGPIKIALVGASYYFAQRKPPRTPDDLARHCCVQYRRGGSDGVIFDWLFERNGKSRAVPVKGRVIVNTPELALRAAVDGLGIAYTAAAQAEPFVRSGQLIRILEDWSPAIQGLFLYHSGHRQVPAALRALIDMMQAANNTASSARSIKDPFTAV
jgi:DNA-binding transcriptional LysR family regulator